MTIKLVLMFKRWTIEFITSPVSLEITANLSKKLKSVDADDGYILFRRE